MLSRTFSRSTTNGFCDSFSLRNISLVDVAASGAGLTSAGFSSTTVEGL